MKRLAIAFAIAAFCATTLSGVFLVNRAHAAINNQISFQGKLTNPDGTNVTDGNYSLRFRIYTDPSADTGSCANTCKWEETQGTVAVAGGLFNVNLGSSTTLPGSVDFNGNALYLGVKVGSDAEMTPRVRLTASPYSFNSDLLDGLDSSALVQLSPSGQQTGNINVSGTITSGAVNGISVGSTIQPSASGALTIQSNGANALNLESGGAAAINIGVGGTSVTGINFGNVTSNPAIDFNGSGTFDTTTGTTSINGNTTVTGTKTFTVNGGLTTLGAGLTFSGTSARTITGPGTGGLTVTVAGGPLALSTTTSGTLSVTSAGTLTLTGAAASTWDIGNNLLSLQTTNNGAITTGSGLLTLGGNQTFSGTSARTITGPSTGGLTVTVGSGPLAISTTTSGALTLTAAAASTWSTSAGGLTIQAAGTNTLTLNTGGAGTVDLGNTNTTTINIGGTSGSTTNIAVGNVAHTVHIADGGSSTNQVVTIGSTNSGSSTTIQGNTMAIKSGANITLGTSDTTATLLVLDYKTTTGDPAAVNGGSYYNSANNKFRCAQNSIWMNCSNEFNTVTKTADQAAAQSSTTMQNDTALTFPVAANTTYVFDAWIPINDSNATADAKYTFTTPASSTLNIMTSYYASATTNTICNIVASGTACANTTVNLANHFIFVQGQVTVAGTAGSVQFQFAQNTSTAASFPVIKKGATISWHQSN